MPYVTGPRPRSFDGEWRAVDAERARLERKRDAPVVPIPMVRVSPDPVRAWPPGTIWLCTSEDGPLGSHPLKVKRGDGTWDRVAWMVPMD